MAKSRTPRTAARKAAGKSKAARKTARARKPVRKVARKAAKRRSARRLAVRRKAVSKARRGARALSTARKAVRKAAKSPMRAKAKAKRALAKKSKAPVKPAPMRVAAAPTPKATARTTKPARAAKPAAPVRKPALDRERRRLPEASLPPTPPSSLDLDQRASAARSGRREIEEHLSEHNETGPVLTAGDVDANWEAAYSSGDEAPGGDNPTPDQDVVDEIGRSLGLEYNDNEELKGADKVEARDRHRWELDPASSEDYDDRE
jgi:Family of unknown function (DUF6335)